MIRSIRNAHLDLFLTLITFYEYFVTSSTDISIEIHIVIILDGILFCQCSSFCIIGKMFTDYIFYVFIMCNLFHFFLNGFHMVTMFCNTIRLEFLQCTRILTLCFSICPSCVKRQSSINHWSYLSC